MAGKIPSSKPTLTGISSTSPSTDALYVNREGIIMERGGPIYMAHSFMTSTSTTVGLEDRVTSTTLTKTSTEECCEAVTSLLTSVFVTNNTSPTVASVAVVDVKEDIFLPILFTDSYGNLMPVIRSTTAEDVYGGQPLIRNRE